MLLLSDELLVMIHVDVSCDQCCQSIGCVNCRFLQVGIYVGLQGRTDSW